MVKQLINEVFSVVGICTPASDQRVLEALFKAISFGSGLNWIALVYQD